jgi:hypothetical protein
MEMPGFAHGCFAYGVLWLICLFSQNMQLADASQKMWMGCQIKETVDTTFSGTFIIILPPLFSY